MAAAAETLAAYEAVVTLAETELALVAAGHWDELERVRAAWDQALAALPPRPPAEAEPLLRRALALAEQAEALIADAREGVLRELGGVGRQRAVGRAYSPSAAVPADATLNLSA
ncbi:MAG: hypothetical protein QM679_02515 [Patulibacter sp.]